MNLAEKLSPIFMEIVQECIRQDEKWGEQDHPFLSGKRDIEFYIEKRNGYQEMNKSSDFPKSWATIFLEEVYEALSETDPAKQREEMIQAAAVAVRIIEYLDRRIEEEKC